MKVNMDFLNLSFGQLIEFVNGMQKEIEELKTLIVKQLPQKKESKFLTVKDAMQLLNYSNQTSFLKAVRDKHIPKIQVSTKKILFDENDLNNYIHQNYSSYKLQMLENKRDCFLSRSA